MTKDEKMLSLELAVEKFARGLSASIGMDVVMYSIKESKSGGIDLMSYVGNPCNLCKFSVTIVGEKVENIKLEVGNEPKKLGNFAREYLVDSLFDLLEEVGRTKIKLYEIRYSERGTALERDTKSKEIHRVKAGVSRGKLTNKNDKGEWYYGFGCW